MSKRIKITHKGLDCFRINNPGKLQFFLFLSFAFRTFSLKFFTVTYVKSVNVYAFLFRREVKNNKVYFFLPIVTSIFFQYFSGKLPSEQKFRDVEAIFLRPLCPNHAIRLPCLVGVKNNSILCHTEHRI